MLTQNILPFRSSQQYLSELFSKVSRAPYWLLGEDLVVVLHHVQRFSLKGEVALSKGVVGGAIYRAETGGRIIRLYLTDGYQMDFDRYEMSRLFDQDREAAAGKLMLMKTSRCYKNAVRPVMQDAKVMRGASVVYNQKPVIALTNEFEAMQGDSLEIPPEYHSRVRTRLNSVHQSSEDLHLGNHYIFDMSEDRYKVFVSKWLNFYDENKELVFDQSPKRVFTRRAITWDSLKLMSVA